jgi:hypothetical protein
MSVNKFRLLIPALAFAVLLVAGGKSAMAQNASTTTTTTKEPLATVAYTCDTFEPITFTGYQKTVYEVKNSHDGTPLKFKMTTSWDDVVGTTPSGRVYKGTMNTKDAADLDGLPSYHRFTISQRFKSKTKAAADTVYTFKLKIKVDEFGNVTQDKEDERSECKQ